MPDEPTPEVQVTIKGNVLDFTRIDNAYKSFRREAEKLLANWQIEVKVEYSEVSAG